MFANGSILASVMDTFFPHNLKIAGSSPLQIGDPTEHSAPLPPPLLVPLVTYQAKSLHPLQPSDPFPGYSTHCPLDPARQTSFLPSHWD